MIITIVIYSPSSHLTCKMYFTPFFIVILNSIVSNHFSLCFHYYLPVFTVCSLHSIALISVSLKIFRSKLRREKPSEPDNSDTLPWTWTTIAPPYNNSIHPAWKIGGTQLATHPTKVYDLTSHRWQFSNWSATANPPLQPSPQLDLERMTNHRWVGKLYLKFYFKRQNPNIWAQFSN